MNFSKIPGRFISKRIRSTRRDFYFSMEYAKTRPWIESIGPRAWNSRQHLTLNRDIDRRILFKYRCIFFWIAQALLPFPFLDSSIKWASGAGFGKKKTHAHPDLEGSYYHAIQKGFIVFWKQQPLEPANLKKRGRKRVLAMEEEIVKLIHERSTLLHEKAELEIECIGWIQYNLPS